MDRILGAVNARLRAQAAAARPQVRELQRALTQAEREIANYTRAVARGDFTSLERALTAAEQRRASLQIELTQVIGRPQPATVQLTPTALERHLQGLTEKLRSGMRGRVRKAIDQSVARIVASIDGGLTIEAKPGGSSGWEKTSARWKAT